ncbi:hypothetical protein CgunFtcFv8_008762 [Champsocephalus gunnari]|uniref:Uncharacterized protein n=1 Tax=Champsocephalus gunnari TaxID=52237 RepID=A0AAN8D0W5_CHAGU|nr:hypothetical protein CgunFtcFv8_008762 [Champsocephalus gunnari]
MIADPENVRFKLFLGLPARSPAAVLSRLDAVFPQNIFSLISLFTDASGVFLLPLFKLDCFNVTDLNPINLQIIQCETQTATEGAC